MSSTTQLIRWSLPGWVLFMFTTLFIGISILINNELRIQLSTQEIEIIPEITLALVAFVASFSVPLGFIIYQIYYWLYWYAPIPHGLKLDTNPKDRGKDILEYVSEDVLIKVFNSRIEDSPHDAFTTLEYRLEKYGSFSTRYLVWSMIFVIPFKIGKRVKKIKLKDADLMKQFRQQWELADDVFITLENRLETYKPLPIRYIVLSVIFNIPFLGKYAKQRMLKDVDILEQFRQQWELADDAFVTLENQLETYKPLPIRYIVLSVIFNNAPLMIGTRIKKTKLKDTDIMSKYRKHWELSDAVWYFALSQDKNSQTADYWEKRSVFLGDIYHALSASIVSLGLGYLLYLLYETAYFITNLPDQSTKNWASIVIPLWVLFITITWMSVKPRILAWFLMVLLSIVFLRLSYSFDPVAISIPAIIAASINFFFMTRLLMTLKSTRQSSFEALFSLRKYLITNAFGQHNEDATNLKKQS